MSHSWQSPSAVSLSASAAPVAAPPGADLAVRARGLAPWSQRVELQAGRQENVTVQLEAGTLGTLFYNLSPAQPGGPGVFFIRTPVSVLTSTGSE